MSFTPSLAAPLMPFGSIRHLYNAASSRQTELFARLNSARLFADCKRYGLFLNIQHRITSDLERIYTHPLRSDLLPQLTNGGHLRRIEQDFGDLRLPILYRHEPFCAYMNDLRPADLLGHLFVAEGMRLTLPYFLKQAEKLGLGSTCGARHLADDAAVVRRRWARFVEATNAIVFAPQDLLVMAQAADEAMQRVCTILDEETYVDRKLRTEAMIMQGMALNG